MTTQLTPRPARARVAGLLFAFLATATVLGATVTGMQPRVDADAPVVAMESVTITATKLN